MRIYDIITKKKRAQQLTDEEIRSFVSEYTAGKIPDYQVASLLMAICLRGMNDQETAALTDAIANSGSVVDLSQFGALSVDKHSTDGVGDKTTLIIAPIVASLGAKVAKMSGRGLGHTGGTIDKLEAIPGYNTSLSNERFLNQVRDIGIAVIAQSGNLAPADKKLYALRDVTATVDSIPLITSSIMGKKLASGAGTIVLDVKCGSGAFTKTPEDAEILAQSMVNIGKACTRHVAALITDMDRPLGLAVGNTLEVKEAIDTLRAKGPEDLTEVSIKIAAAMLHLSLGISYDEAIEKATGAITDGSAFKKFKEWITAQGADSAFADNTDLFEKAKHSKEIYAPTDGYVTSMNAEAIGTAAMQLGAGRAEKDDVIDFSAGIILNKKTGDSVKRGELIATLYANDDKKFAAAEKTAIGAYTFAESPPEHKPLIYKAIGITEDI